MSKRKHGGLKEILASGKFPGMFVEDKGAGWTDTVSPHWWGMGTKHGPFAKKHTPDGKPIWSNTGEYAEACRIARHHGENVRPMKPRDYQPRAR